VKSVDRTQEDWGDLDRCSVLAVDDHEALRRIVQAVVDDPDAGFDLVGEASSGEQAIELATRLHPDLVLMDVRMPGIGGIEAARRIRALLPSVVIVLISVDGAAAVDAAPGDCGADAVMSKHTLTQRTLSTLWHRHRRRPPRAGPDADRE
jgi:two-component system invasion response regulator UvrY